MGDHIETQRSVALCEGAVLAEIRTPPPDESNDLVIDVADADSAPLLGDRHAAGTRMEGDAAVATTAMSALLCQAQQYLTQRRASSGHGSSSAATGSGASTPGLASAQHALQRAVGDAQGGTAGAASEEGAAAAAARHRLADRSLDARVSGGLRAAPPPCRRRQGCL